VWRRPALRRVLPGLLVSALGDGMSLVAVAWLALKIAPPGRAGIWTGLAVAAYALPATIGAALLGRLVRPFSGAGLVAVDATLRAVALGTIAVLAVAGLLNPIWYVALLAVSSLLHAWGHAGAYTLIAEQVPDQDRIAGNALLSTFVQGSVVAGPALAGALTALAGPGWVIGLDAVSFAVLAATAWPLATRSGRPTTVDEREAGAWGTILANPSLLGLIGVTCAFFFLYGPVEVALPIHVAEGLNGSAGLLGAYWAVFGVGAVIGGLCAGLLPQRQLWLIVAAIIVGWGAALLPIALFDAVLPGMLGLAAGGLIYGPFTAIGTGLFQRTSPPQVLSRVLAARTALTTPSAALGTLVGGPVVTAIGSQPTLLLSGLLTIALGLVVAAVSALMGGGPPERWCRRRRGARDDQGRYHRNHGN
jgi:hypothetical protein